MAASEMGLAEAAASSLVLFFDLDFLVLFGRAHVSVVSPLHWVIDLLVSGGAMKLNAPRTANLRPRVVGCMANRAAAVDPAVVVICDVFGSAA